MKKSRFKPIVFAVLLLSLWIGALGGQVASQAIIQRTLTILGTTDLHGNIWGFSYEDNKETTNNGMARIATYVQKVRAESPNVILIDNGDAIQGTILTCLLYTSDAADDLLCVYLGGRRILNKQKQKYNT